VSGVGRVAIALVALTLMAAAPTPLMQWPDLLGRPMPQADQRIAYGPGENQFAELWLPKSRGRHPVVLMVHGGCWRARVAKLTIMNYVADDLRRRGLAVWNIEYRGVDQPGGGYLGTFQDVAAAADALRGVARTHDLDLRRIVVVGHSAGGHLGAWLAARPRLPASSPLRSGDPMRVAAVVNLGGLPDLEADKAAGDTAACGAAVVDQLTGPPSAARPDVFADTSPAERLPLGVRQAVINATRDAIAPPWLGRAYAERARRAGEDVTFTEIADAGHVELIAPGTPAWEKAARIIVGLAR
jgi:acetyl esterase/lipase